MELCGWWVAALALAAAGCGDLLESGSPPRLEPIGDKSVLVGEKLTILFKATDPDGDDLTFFIKGRPESAQFVAMPDGTSAVFSWIPEVQDSAPGGKEHEVEFTAEDDTGAWDSETVTITVLPQWAPAFLNPPGYVLDLAEQSQLEFIVEVKDDSASHVDIAVLSGPPNAYLQQSEKKKAYFSWRPDEGQLKTKLFWYVRFSGSGYVADASQPGVETLLYQITHDVIIVIINSDYKGCPGSPPVILHTVPADLHWDPAGGVNGYPIAATVTDGDSFIAHANLFWTIASPSLEANFTALEMTPSGTGGFTGTIPKAAAGPGLMVYYFLEAWDNDDYAGSACDHATRLPKQGYYGLAVYDPGYEDACFDDADEDNDSPGSALAQAPATLPARRLCSGDHDYYRFSIGTSPQASVAVEAYGNPQALTLEVLDANLIPVGVEHTGSASLSVPGSSLPWGEVLVHLSSSTGQPVTYTLSVAVQEEQCLPDELESNNTVSQAPLIGEGEFNGLTLCPGDDDWFRLEIPAGNVLSVLVDFAAAAGDLDLFLYGSNGVDLAAAAQTTSDDEVIDYYVPNGGTHYLAVKGVSGSSNAYNLTVTFGAPSETCLEDSFAPNQYPEEAPMVPVGKYDQLIACPNREDWFAIGLNGGETLKVDALASGGNLSISLYESTQGTILCASSPTGSGASMTCSIPAAGIYMFVVTSTIPMAVAYGLEVGVTEDMSTCHEDRFENNDSFDQATDLKYTVTTWVKLCGQDADWFRFQGYPMELIVAAIGYKPELGSADLYLYDTDGVTMLAMTNAAAGVPYLEYPLAAEGIYYLVAKGPDFYGNVPYDLFLWLE